MAQQIKTCKRKTQDDEFYEWFNELREERVIEIANILDIKKDIEKKRG